MDTPPAFNNSRPPESGLAARNWKIAALLAITAFLILLIAVFASAYLREVFGLRRLDSQAVVMQVRQLNQLITVKYSIQRVVGLREPKVPFGEESILIMVQGEALAGVDLSTVTSRDVTYTARNQVSLTLPRAKLFNAFIDEKQTKVWDRQITWWTPWVPYDPDLEHKARLQALDDLRNTALNMGILDQAQKNAQTAIRDFLAAFDLKANFKTRPID